MSFKNIGSWLKSHYDKILAIAVLVLLVGSLLYLAVRIGTMSADKERFVLEIKSYKPKHPASPQIDTKVFNEAMTSIEKPLQLSSEQWTNSAFFVPERRVWCVDCRRPIEFAATKCPFCGTEQPKPIAQDEFHDRDGDRMPDMWEIKYGLNPDDPLDAEKDNDGDGFTNLEEFLANPSTDPTDATSHPPITAKLRLQGIVPDPFNLKFKSSAKLPDDKLQFGLNFSRRDKTGRLETRTAFVKLGEVFKTEANEIFKVESYTNLIVAVTNVRISAVQNIDESALFLKRGDKSIKLVKNRDVQWDECTAHLLFTVDNSRHVVKIDHLLDLKNEKFKVINIDIKNESVLLESVKDGQRTTIEKFPESKPENVKEAVGGAVTDSNAKPAENHGEKPL